MTSQDKPLDRLVYELRERAKELNCLYEVQELLHDPKISFEEVCEGIIRAIPPGWQYPDICQAIITYSDRSFKSPNFSGTKWGQSAEIVVQDRVVGNISVFYIEERPEEDEGPFLKEERKLIETIAEQLGHYILHHQLKEVFETQKLEERERKAEWWVVLDLLRRTDPKLLIRVSRKMVNFLCRNGIEEAESMLEYFSPAYRNESDLIDVNQPYQIEAGQDALAIVNEIFFLADRHYGEREILEYIQKWIKEDQSDFLVNVLVDPSSSLDEIDSILERYHHLKLRGLELSESRDISARVSLVRRLLSDQPKYLNIARKYIQVDDVYGLFKEMIFPIGSHGKVGGKGAGLILAMQILQKAVEENGLIQKVRMPKTKYIASDGLFKFLSYNGLGDIPEHKYREMEQVRQEYPYVVHLFKNSPLPPEIIKNLSIALDDFGTVPLIVRSSSLLEDQVGMAFAGKYKSLFIANQGSKEKRLQDLMDAVTEVYASMFGPDPIEYRLERGILDYHEEMAIMIQEVVGSKVGCYYFPAFAGVAFSKNEFPWSSRINREDGLVRIVPGLGTRAVDRLSDDYPIMVSPGKPGLRVNVSVDEIVRYSPKEIDVINLERGTFESVAIVDLLRQYGNEYPDIHQLVSVLSQGHIKQPRALGIDFERNDLIVNFESLLTKTTFLKQVHAVLIELEKNLGYPVDIEFAFDRGNFYLLQCRSQSNREENRPARIPRNLPQDKIVFSAEKYITNGAVSNITHIVYVDPNEYSNLAEYQDFISVGKAVSSLNKILPKREFILIGPGRWGSRGDRKLGVKVTYSDINNTKMLIEVAHKQGKYMPDLSFGTHFFQDLVEASIRYLPLYPDDPGIIFNEGFLKNSENKLADLLPEFKNLSQVVRVIDVADSTNGALLEVLMNADSQKAVGFLANPKEDNEFKAF
jgi:hypothetical protein